MAPIYTLDVIVALVMFFGMLPMMVADIAPLFEIDLGGWGEDMRSNDLHEVGNIGMAIVLAAGAMYLGGQFTFLFSLVYIPLVLIHNHFVVPEAQAEMVY